MERNLILNGAFKKGRLINFYKKEIEVWFNINIEILI